MRVGKEMTEDKDLREISSSIPSGNSWYMHRDIIDMMMKEIFNDRVAAGNFYFPSSKKAVAEAIKQLDERRDKKLGGMKIDQILRGMDEYDRAVFDIIGDGWKRHAGLPTFREMHGLKCVSNSERSEDE